MCVVSMVGDHYTDKFNDDYYKRFINNPPAIQPMPGIGTITIPDPVTRQEIEQIKRELLEMKALLIRAVEYDKRNNEPHCEIDEKVKLLKQMAAAFGIDISDVFK